MIKKIAIGFGVGLVVLLLLFYAFRRQVFEFFLVPSHAYTPLSVEGQLDYRQPDSWLALPQRQDSVDVLAPGETDRQQEALVDVFFIHPTTWFSSESWNAPMDGSSDQIIPRNNTLYLNASAYNGCCRIFVPKYRQATLGTYGGPDLDLGPVNGAFIDVLAAFDTYMELYNEGRPIIIAAHSQGSDHGMMLLKHRFSKTPLHDQLVASYLPGRPFAKDNTLAELPDVPICEQPDQLACYVTWMTFGPDADLTPFIERAAYLKDGKIVARPAEALTCVNPVSWRRDGDWHEQEQGHGLYLYDKELGQVTFRDERISARCDEHGVLKIKPPFWGLMTGRTNYHIHDVPLFYKEVRKNAQLRVATFLKSWTPQPSRLQSEDAKSSE